MYTAKELISLHEHPVLQPGRKLVYVLRLLNSSLSALI